MDNCVTHHICSKFFAFVDKIHKVESIGVRDIVGSASAEGIDTVTFTITYSNVIKHEITNDAIYPPSTTNNNMLTSQWSSDKMDNAGVLYNNKYN